jgi:hypothetical protein
VKGLTRAGVLAVLLLAGTSGCARRATAEEEKRAQAQEVVKLFFAALPGKDCDVLRSMLVLGPGDDDCAGMVDALQEHGLRLVEVLGAEVDGRDPEAVMVHVRLERDGQRREVSLRVVHRPQGWKLKL